MSDLSKVTIKDIKRRTLYLRIERTHPDAPSLKWVTTQSKEKLKAICLYRLIALLDSHKLQGLPIYQEIFLKVKPTLEEETGEEHTLSKYTDLSEEGDWILKGAADQILSKANIVNSDFNSHWEDGLLKNVNPYQIGDLGFPFVEFELEFKEDILGPELIGKTHHSALSITCTDPY